MTTAARTPEELDALLEDAFVLRDPSAPRALFDDGAVLGLAGGAEARGGAAIARAFARLWAEERTYVARTVRVMRARDTALVVADAAIHVAVRGRDGAWRSAISLLELTRSEDA